MTRTVVALYDNFEHANMAVRELVDNGFSRDDISLMAGDERGEYGRYLGSDEYRNRDMSGGEASTGAGVGAGIGATLGGIGGLLVGLGALVIPGIGPVVAAGPLSAALAGLAGAGAGALAGGITGGLIGALVDVGVPEETAQYYSEGVRRGGTLLTVRTDDDMSGRAVTIMNRHQPVDINSRAAMWRDEGWTGFHSDTDVTRDQESSGSMRSVVDHDQHHDYETSRDYDRENIPTTGEGDSTHSTGGVMGSSYSGATGQDFGSGSSYGTSHETGRDYDQGSGATSQHRDSVARGENTYTGDIFGGGQQQTGDTNFGDRSHSDMGQGLSGTMGSDINRGQYRDFGYYDTAFHNHFNTMYGTSYQYNQYQPAYRYGYDLATDPRYTDRDWMDVEPEARRYWDEREPGAWERFKDAVQHAWSEVRNAVD